MADQTVAKRTSLLSSSLKTVDEAREKLEKFNETLNASNDAGAGKAETVMSIRSGSALKTLRISSSAPPVANTTAAPENFALFDAETETVIQPVMTSPALTKRRAVSVILNGGALFLTFLWLGLCASYIVTDIGWTALTEQKPHMLGGFIAGIMAPVALLWMILSFIQRGADVRLYAQALRGELQAMIFPSEERSQIIHKDIEMLVRQAVDLSSASKDVLRSLHKARMGLRNEIQGMAGLSRKTEFHIDRLSENLNERSVKLLALTEEIESRTAKIGEKSSAGAKAWDDASSAIAGRAADMEATISKGAERLLAAADLAQGKADGISGALEQTYGGLKMAIDDIAARLETLSGEFDAHKKALSDTTAQVASETSRLGDALAGQMRDLETMTEQTVEKIGLAGSRILESRETLSAAAKDLSDEGDGIAAKIKTSVDSMKDASVEIAEKAQSAEQAVQMRAAALKDMLDDMNSKTAAIDVLGTETANKLSEGLGLALSGAESIGGAVRRAVESLSRATEEAQKQAESLITKTKDNIEALNNAGAGNVEHVRTIVTLLEQSRGQIESATGLAETQVARLSETVESQIGKIDIAQATLSERIESVRDALSQPLQAVTRAVSEADAKHEAIATTLTRRVKDLTDASDRAADNAEKIRDLLRDQAQDISTLAGQIAGHSRSISDHMGTQKADLSRKVTESLEQIESVRAALEDQAGRLSGLAYTAQNDITALNASISGANAGISETAKGIVSGLSDVELRFRESAALLDRQGREATSSIESASITLSDTASQFEPMYQKAIEQAGAAHDRLERLRGGFDTTVDSSLKRLGELGGSFDARLEKLQSGADRATALLKSSSEELRDRAEDIEQAATSASDKMRGIESTLNNQASDIHLATDHALLKIETVQKAIDEQFHDFTASVARALAQVKDAGEEFGRQAAQAETTSDLASTRIGAAGDKAETEVMRLKSTASELASHVQELTAHIQDNAERLLQTSQGSLLDLKKTGDSFAFRATEISEQMRASLKTSKEYGAELESQADAIAKAGHRSADEISRAVSRLGTKLDDIDSATVGITSRFDETHQKLKDESLLLIDASTKALTVTEEASEIFAKQSAAMFKAAQEAAKQVDAIRDAEWKARREAFLSSAKFVVESLHSLSVDITRISEGGVQEKTWKAYQAGDVAAFTKRLADAEGRVPVEKIRDKYTNDSEFRNYVGRFLRQFEEVLDQASANDHGDLLGATFFSSDVGRLYQSLCTATGREPRRMKTARPN